MVARGNISILHDILPAFEKASNHEIGSYCHNCKHVTPTSIHGRCSNCGYQKFPSTALDARSKRRAGV